MPIRRKKMDEGGDGDEGRGGTSVFPSSAGVVGLVQSSTKALSSTSSSSMKNTANVGEVDENVSQVASSNNDGRPSEVSQIIAVAMQQIDNIIAETRESALMETSTSSADVLNANTNSNRKVNADPEESSCRESAIALNSGGGGVNHATKSIALSSSSSTDSGGASDESMTSDFGLTQENGDQLTPPTSSRTVGGIGMDASNAKLESEPNSPSSSFTSAVFVQQLALRLADTLNHLSTCAGNGANGGSSFTSHHTTVPKPDPKVARVLLRWLHSDDQTRSPSPSMSTVSCPEYVELQDKLHRLETDRESLSLQVSVLSEQVGAQSDKIKDLESLLDDKRKKLDSAEEMLHDELSTRSGLETDRLDLLSEISQLKLKLASLERDKITTQHKLHSAQSEIHSLQRVMQEKYNEIVAQAQQQPQQQSRAQQQQHAQLSNYPTPTGKQSLSAIDPAGEIEQLRSAVQHLMSENAEKEQRLEQMRLLMERQLLRNTSGPLNGQAASGRSTSVDSELCASSGSVPYAHRSSSVGSGTMMGTSSLANAPSGHVQRHPRLQHVRETQEPVPMDINQQLRQLLAESDGEVMAASGASSSLPSSASFPESILYNSRPPPYPSVYLHGMAGSVQSSASYTSNLSSNVSAAGGVREMSGGGSACNLATWSAPVTPYHQQTNVTPVGGPQQSSNAGRQLAAELNELIPQYRRSPLGFGHTGSLPRGVGQGTSPNKSKLSGAGSTAPSVDSDEESGQMARSGNEKVKREKKQKSLKTFISKLTRSNSQEFGNGEAGGDFRRGGFVRATAGPRLRSWSRDSQAQRSVPIRPTVEQFGKWTSEDVADWLNEIGFTMYVADCRRNIRSGRHMMSLTPADMERELGIKNQLHKKKLVIALRNIELGKPEPSDQMDYHQVLRWLDDVGLPQFRDVFAEHRIDGALLNLLTVDDLLQMRISSALHHSTIARGIQMLRMVGFNLNRFIRKFNPDIIGKGPLPHQVQLWTQHCITEWLRAIDLTEFTPNLMCAGIHGALIVLEPTFTAESLAAVLQIPTQKTLIRRHLTTHFNQLLGQETVAVKREALSTPFAVQLVPGLKVKAAKKGFTLARRKHNRTEVYMEPDDLVCPLTPNRKPPSSAALLDRVPESISEQMLSSLSSSNV